MPSFRLTEVPTISSFSEIIPVLWRSYTTPRDAAMEFVYPIKGTTKSAREMAMEDSKRRIIASHNADPSSHWIQVLDTENYDAVVGAAEWHVYCGDTEKDNPNVLPDGVMEWPETDLDWWPEGERKRFTVMMFDTSLAIMRKRMTRPHIALSMCFTDPSYRNKGVATMMVNWGLQKADEWGLECFTCATLDMSMPLYRKLGFLVVDRTDLVMEDPGEGESEEWEACRRQLLPYWWYNMWRPIGGKWEEGMRYPWEE